MCDGELYTYSRSGAALKLTNYCSQATTVQEAEMRLEAMLRAIFKNAAYVYQLGEIRLQQSSYGFSARVCLATEDILTFNLIY